MVPPTERQETVPTKEHLYEKRLSRLEDRVSRLIPNINEELNTMLEVIEQQQAAIRLLNKQMGFLWALRYEQVGKPFGDTREGFKRWLFTEEIEHGHTWKTFND